MAEASIPVDLFNPGQVFACLGFLEAADLLCGDAEGGFDWSDQSVSWFKLAASGDRNPFSIVLEFVADARVFCIAPIGPTQTTNDREDESQESSETESPLESSHDCETSELDDQSAVVTLESISRSEVFPSKQGDQLALPIRLEGQGSWSAELSHWADGSSRTSFKLYSGNRSAYSIACSILHGKREKEKRLDSLGRLTAIGISQLWASQREVVLASPLSVLGPMGGSFNFDPRGAWTSIDAGYSPNKQGHRVWASPIVELLAAWGLQNSRPEEYETRQVRYAVWSEHLPPILARPAMSGAQVPFAVRRFQFELELSGKNKVVTFAREEIE